MSALCIASTVAAQRASSLAPRPSPLVPAVLRVCADPNNLPFSNRRLEGFENRIAELVAREMGATVRYTWWAQRRGFFRNTLNAGACDVVLGVPAGMEMALTTRPYYRSGYVFVTRRRGGVAIRSLDDPALRRVRIGVQLVGDDGANPPPAHALARRGIVQNVVGYSVLSDYRQPNPPARIIDAVARGDVDVAIAWGPLAGYFAKRAAVPLAVTPLRPRADGRLPFEFDIAMGVRRGDTALRDELNAIIARRRAEIDRILDDYGVPRAPGGTRSADAR
ncbi:MAG TPA: substrate-binding domain-containing protein [Gemmatimonadaceae bacterium]|nr:substrate-binding domain-containing protein [Gemmatimonadaceae bacterium]